MTATLAAPPPHMPASSAPTLDALLTEAWNDVSAGAAAECPVCAGRMQPRWTAGAGVVGGRCVDCGTTLEQVYSLPSVSVEEDRQELAELEEGWMRAMQQRDQAKLEELVAPGFRFTALHLAPEPMSREQWMGAAMGGYHIVSFAFESMDIDVFGDAAVIHARYSQIANYDAVDLSHGYRLTDVWARNDGQWQVVARHSSILS